MKLSDAILAGCENTEQGFDFVCTIENGKVHLCALGAALNAVKPEFWKYPRYDLTIMIVEEFPEVLSIYHDEITYRDQVEYLNDVRGWTREEIAAWLKGQGF